MITFMHICTDPPHVHGILVCCRTSTWLADLPSVSVPPSLRGPLGRIDV